MRINRVTKILFLLPLTLVATYIACYFIVMREDLKYFFVFRHALNSGPDYAPSIIVGLTIICFVALWLIVFVVSAIIRVRKR
jgi:threonine/homoserine/homoserine lactone efflux protein